MSLWQKLLRWIAAVAIALVVVLVVWMLIFDTGFAGFVLHWWQWAVVEPAYDPNDMLREVRWWAFPSILGAFGLLITFAAIPIVAGLLSLAIALEGFGVLPEIEVRA